MPFLLMQYFELINETNIIFISELIAWVIFFKLFIFYWLFIFYYVAFQIYGKYL